MTNFGAVGRASLFDDMKNKPKRLLAWESRKRLTELGILEKRPKKNKPLPLFDHLERAK